MSDGTEEYKGDHIVVRFEAARCIHSRQCVLGRPDVFIPNADGPWIKPDNASAEAISAVVASCPSGALTFERRNGAAAEDRPVVNVVRVRENGPLAFHGELTISGETERLRATLCRCGASRHKPFCDNSHIEAGFKASGEPASQKSEPLSQRNGRLRITPAPNGPLLVKGPLEVCTGTGRTITRTVSTAFCRCGGSGNKPFCDGTHTKIDFRDS